MPSPASFVEAKLQKLCIKCKLLKSEFEIHHAQYCRECFAFNVKGKIKNKLKQRKGDDVVFNDDMAALVAFSGGSSSRLLLEILAEHHQASLPHRKGCFKKVVLAHIDERRLTNDRSAEQVFQLVQRVARLYPFDLKVRCISSELKQCSPLEISAQFKECTFLEDFYATLKYKMLSTIAIENDCNVVLLGDNMTNNAAMAMADMVKGRGFTVPLRMMAFDDISYPVPFSKPMLQVSQLEVDAFVHKIRDLESMQYPALSDSSSDSLTKVSKSFVYSLQADYPSTSSAISRTLSRAQTSVKKELSSPRCVLCHLPHEPLSEVWRDKNTIRQLKDHPKELDCEPLAGLCYGCRGLELDLNDPSAENVARVQSMMATENR